MKYSQDTIQAFEVAKPMILVNAVEAFKLFEHSSGLYGDQLRKTWNDLSGSYLQTYHKPIPQPRRSLYDYLLLAQDNRAFRTMFLITVMSFFTVSFLTLGLVFAANPAYLVFGGAGCFLLILLLVFNFLAVS
jgi:hypothetical protein